jgi:hypothetical protein
MVLLFNAMGVVILTVHSDGMRKGGMKEILTEVIKNPLIRAILIGLPFMFFEMDFPVAVQRGINYIGNTATPLALIGLGAGIDLSLIKNKVRLAVSAALIKTVACPLAFVSVAVLLGFSGEEIAVIFILSAAPSAVASYIMAKNMGSDANLAGQILTLTTVMCPVTIFAGSLLLKTMGLL